MGSESGSPLLARQNSGNYTIVFIAIIFIAILLVIYLLIKWINKIHSSPQWVESHKNLPTTLKNINHVSKTSNLDKNEKLLLIEICSRYKPLNLEFLIKNEKSIDDLFKQEFQFLNKENDTDKITILFLLRYKLEKTYKNSLIITSSKSIIAGQQLIYTDRRGTLWTLSVYENNNQGLFISLPQSFASSNIKPEQLSKLNITFTSNTGIAYIMIARVVRYEQGKDGATLMLLAHTNSLRALQRRNSKRMTLNTKCTFSAVDVSKNSDDEKNTTYTPKQNKYEGTIQDISSNGCRVNCTLPIHQGQFISVNFSIDGTKTDNAIGLIVSTTATSDNTHYILHIQFVKITKSVRNRIYALIYNYL